MLSFTHDSTVVELIEPSPGQAARSRHPLNELRTVKITRGGMLKHLGPRNLRLSSLLVLFKVIVWPRASIALTVVYPYTMYRVRMVRPNSGLEESGRTAF